MNDAKVCAAKPCEKAFKLTDSHGLCLMGKAGGSKPWKRNYAYRGKQKTLHLGIHPLVSLVHTRPVTRLALRLLALKAVRPGELRGAE